MRLLAALIVTAAFATPALAQTENTAAALDPLYQCASITANEQRLACYDSATAALRAATTEGRVVAIDRAQAEAIRRESVGLSLPAIAQLFSGDHESAPDVEAQVVRIYQASGGYATFVLSNGQVWRQTEQRRFNNVRENDTIVISPAAMGSFMLHPSRAGAAHRVRRIS